MSDLNKDFEKWCINNEHAPKNLTKYDDRLIYLCKETEAAWSAWLGAANFYGPLLD